MAEGVVGSLLLSVVLIYLFVNPGYLIPQLDELEVEVCAEEADLTLTNLRGLSTQLAFAIFGQRYKGAVAT